MLVLTNTSKESGALEILNKKTNQWDLIEAKAGDIIAIDGNTYHRSSANLTDKPRALYACVYSNKKLEFQKFYSQKWTFCNCKEISNMKLPKEENSLWEKV